MMRLFGMSEKRSSFSSPNQNGAFGPDEAAGQLGGAPRPSERSQENGSYPGARQAAWSGHVVFSNQDYAPFTSCGTRVQAACCGCVGI